MHDFLHSFHGPGSSGGHTAGRSASRLTTPATCESQLAIMRSFDAAAVPFTAFRPAPATPRRRRRGSKPSTLNP